MAQDNSNLPVTHDDTSAAFLSALARAASVPVGKNLIDCLTEDNWNDCNVEGWNINSGSCKYEDEIDIFSNAWRHT